ncbi:MAG: YafY family protein [Chloroflexota bacterium]
MNRVDRLLGYLLTFQGRSLVRAQDLAEKFEVSERTVYRDIDALCEVGVPLYGTPGEGYRLMEGYYLPPIMFSEQEARALYIAVSMLVGFSEVGATQDAANAALEKIRVVLPETTLAQIEALQAVLGFYKFGSPLFNLDDERFAQIQRAIQQHQLIRISYHAMHNNQVHTRDIEPMHLAFVDNVWIVHGYCRLRADFRNFRVDRIDSLQVLPQTFEPRSWIFSVFIQYSVFTVQDFLVT